MLAAQHEQWSRPTRPESPVESEKGHETVVVGIDGTCVMGRDAQGHEVKVATVFGLDEHAVQSKRPLLLSRRYCATSLGIGAFWPMVWALATRWGARSAKRVVVLGDGAHWIWKLARERLPSALCILDFYHASEHLHALARALWGEGSAQALQWASHHSHLLKEQGPGQVFAELHRLRKTLRATKRQRVEQELTYFENNRQRMDYPAYQTAGLPIGSGAVEGACKTLVKERMSGAGQRWSDAGTEQMVALRTILFNEDWDKIWTKRAA